MTHVNKCTLLMNRSIFHGGTSCHFMWLISVVLFVEAIKKKSTITRNDLYFSKINKQGCGGHYLYKYIVVYLRYKSINS